MKVQIIEVLSNLNKDGVMVYKMGVMGTFTDYGKPRLKVVDVTLTSGEFELYNKNVGKTMDVDLVMPVPQFPLTIRK